MPKKANQQNCTVVTSADKEPIRQVEQSLPTLSEHGRHINAVVLQDYGVEYGPITMTQLRKHVQERRISLDTLVRSSQQTEWIDARCIEGLSAPPPDPVPYQATQPTGSTWTPQARPQQLPSSAKNDHNSNNAWTPSTGFRRVVAGIAIFVLILFGLPLIILFFERYAARGFDQTNSIIIFWLCISGIVGVIARNKGRSYVGYFLLSLLTSPLVGIFLLLWVGSNTKKIEAAQIQAGHSKKCPFCAELIKVEAKVCRFCSRELKLP